MIEILVNDRVVAANTLEEMLDTLLESMARLLDRLQRGRRMLEHVVGNGDGGVDDEFEEIRRARFNILIGVLEGLSLKAKGVRKAYKATKALRDRCVFFKVKDGIMNAENCFLESLYSIFRASFTLFVREKDTNCE